MVKWTASNKVTLKDIAERIGCSCNTVSLAMRNSTRVSEETRTRVHEIAEQLGYVANQAARNLRSNRTGMIGVYTRALYDAVRTEFVNRLVAALHGHGYQPVLGLADNFAGPWHQSPWMQTFRELQVEAIVVVSEETVDLPDWSNNIPIVLVGCSPNESLKCDYLALDRIEAGSLATKHLLSRGHKNIIVSPTEQASFGRGCASLIRDAGFEPHFLPSGIPDQDPNKGRSLGFSCAQQMPEITAAVLGDSGLAAGFIRGILDAGKRVPEDIAVVGYDYFPWAEMVAVPLTTVEQPIASMASMAIDLTQQRLADRNREFMHLTQPHSLVIRGSS